MKKCIKLSVCIMIALLVFIRLGNVLEANYDGNQSMAGFYQMDKDTVDVVFYGSSHVYSGVNVIDLWDDYGIAGYNMAGTMQTLWNSYYNMEETLKYQSPRVMVVDLYGILIEEEYYGSTNVIKNVSSMKFSVNKIRNVWNSVPHEEFLSYMLSYPLTHDSYKELTRGNYDKAVNCVGGEWYKGYKPSYVVTRYDALPQVKTDLEKKMPTVKNRKYLDKMCALAKENHIRLAFIVVPYEGIGDEDQMVYQWAEDYAKENGVMFLNGNEKLEEMKFDPALDYAEESHLNHNGACKFTAYLGDWLMENYDLEDHRGDIRRDSWQKYSDCWAAWNQDQELQECTDIEEYLEKIQKREDYTVIVSLDNHYKENSYVRLLESLLGMDPYGLGSSASIVLENGKILYQTPDEPEYLWYMETKLSDIAISRSYDDAMMEVQVNNIKKNNNYSDVTILVYDRTLDEVADVVTYNRNGVMIR
ncbi:MAG: hypothetical protein NC231_13700 [Bacillus sp. (in: Bacteria)]|nr:hypothetical protein [Bacillus sp. (in: firmicutes)]MCM1427658.1 hypothetical protein [Eubacterium sp.]